MVYLDDLLTLSCNAVVVYSLSKLSELVCAGLLGDDSDLGRVLTEYATEIF